MTTTATLFERTPTGVIQSLLRTVEMDRDTPGAREIGAILDAHPDAYQVRWTRALSDGTSSQCKAERSGNGIVCWEDGYVAWATRDAVTGDAGIDDCLTNARGYRSSGGRVCRTQRDTPPPPGGDGYGGERM